MFRDSELEPQSTVFGTIAQAGIVGNRQSGAPTNPVTINSMRVG